MGTEKRARQKAGTQARREAERAAAAKAKRRRTIIRVGVVALAVVGVFLGITLSGRDDEPEAVAPPPPVGAEVTAPLSEADGAEDDLDDGSEGADTDEGAEGPEGAEDPASPASDDPASEDMIGDDMTGNDLDDGDPATDDMTGDEPVGSTTVPDTAAEAPPAASGDEAPPAQAQTGVPGANYTPYAPDEYGTGPCAPAGGAAERVLNFADAPALCIDPSVPHTAVFATTRGTVRVALDVSNTPGTANSFVNLARSGYYDGTLVHRSAPSIGILQGGSPHTDNAADPGPGYTLWDEGTGFTYRPGQLVMARRGEPNSAGAQYFFTVTAEAGLLDGQGTYVVFGEVISGLDVLADILASHVDQPNNPLGGAPDPPVTVNSLTIEVG